TLEKRPLRAGAAPEETSQPVGRGPLEVKSGSAALKLNVARDASSKTTTVTLSDLHVSKLELARGSKSYAFDKDITLFLKSAIVASEDPNKSLVAQIRKLSVDPLSGDLGGIAKLSMPKPIEASGLDDLNNISAR